MEKKNIPPSDESETTVVLTTPTEKFLYKRFKEESADREKLQSLVDDLKSQIDILQQQLKCVVENTAIPTNQPTVMETSSRAVEYCTDEEELAKETEWIRTKSRKKRKLNTSPTLTLSPQEEKTSNTTDQHTLKVPRPPPIIVDGVEDYQKFFDFLSIDQTAGSFSIKMLNGNSVKINACDGEAYRAITKSLTNSNCLWHSYENKQERPIRVMAKKLPSTCIPDRIKEDLAKQGLKIQEVANKLSWKTKEPLNMFMLTFDNKEDISKVHAIKQIMGCIVDVQPLRTTKLIPQCKRCQVYGHTHKYCSKEPRCVKCTGKHLTKDCKKRAEDKPKCVHCGEAHPANYRGCIIAKEMQKIRNKATKKAVPRRQEPVITVKPPTAQQVKNTAIRMTKQNVSYAQVAAGTSSSNHNRESTFSNENKLDEILKLMTSFNDRLSKIENSTKNAVPKAKK